MVATGLEVLRDRPHVVILGAGASVAAIPHRDKYGRKISVMDGFIDNLGMRGDLSGIEFNSENLEDIYSELSEHSEYDEQRRQLEHLIREYFLKFCLPDEPTIYDLLLLSLKEKDAVATFNWDPLLSDAYFRCQFITTKLPKIFFLHGNVGIKLCMQDKAVYLKGRNICPKCKSELVPCKLLYPVCQKNYNDDPFIKDQWVGFRNYFSRAYIISIFGYSAPETDIEAIRLLKGAWGKSEQHPLSQLEIIDIKAHDDLIDKWKIFIYADHVNTWASFEDSILACFPRRSTENFFKENLEGVWLDYTNRIKLGLNWEQLQKHFEPILSQEMNY